MNKDLFGNIIDIKEVQIRPGTNKDGKFVYFVESINDIGNSIKEFNWSIEAQEWIKDQGFKYNRQKLCKYPENNNDGVFIYEETKSVF